MTPNERRDKILDILYSREWVQAKYLANYFGVGRKTIYRDIDYLSRDFIIERVRARDGGYRLICPWVNGRYILSSDEMAFLHEKAATGIKNEKDRVGFNIIMKKLSDQALMLKKNIEAKEKKGE